MNDHNHYRMGEKVQLEVTLRKKYPYKGFSCPYFSAFGLNTGNMDQKNFEYGHFSRSVRLGGYFRHP